MDHVDAHLLEAKEIIDKLDRTQIRKMVGLLNEVKADGGRIFFLGVGGGAANASHAVNDFRKICGFEAYSPLDNVAELTARTNDDGWETVFVQWLRQSRLGKKDALFVLSVGGGSAEKNISRNLVLAVDYARTVKARILGIVGRDGGHTARMADACVVCLLYTSPSPRDGLLSRMPSSA